MQKATIVSLKVLIVAMITLLAACQVFMVPGVAQQAAYTYPHLSYLQVPGIIVSVLFLLCVQVVLVCVWRLLTMVRASVIFSDKAFLWVDIILGAIILATLLIATTLATLAFADVGSPVMLLCALGIAVGSGLALLIVVIRGLLRNARQLQQDMSEVV